MISYETIKKIMFNFEPETAHHIAEYGLKALPYCRFINNYMVEQNFTNHEMLKQKVFGTTFRNPIGLGAGFDKNATMIKAMPAMGFGYTEIGTMTPKAQPGNPQPRMFRLINDSGLINRMGFNNAGLDAMIVKLKNKKTNVIIGGNIGKNKVTPNEEATSDYEKGFEALFPYVDYFVVNVSSPNTPNLRELQDKKPLTELLSKLMELNNAKESQKPILLKIAPDLTDSQLDDIVEIVKNTKIAGVVATNTTISREGLSYPKDHIDNIGAGGLSGKPLTKRSTEVVKYIIDKSNNSFPVIAAGGVMTPEDAIEKLKVGASLVQIFTGFIYNGPGFAKQINKEILKQGL